MVWYFAIGTLLYIWFLMGYQQHLDQGGARLTGALGLAIFAVLHLFMWPVLIVIFINSLVKNAR